MSEGESQARKPKTRLGRCGVCTDAEAKYTCPRCQMKSCSLACIKQHKQCVPCSGVRDKVALVHKHDMDSLTLLNDYRFLEEIGHKLDSGHRIPIRKFVVQRPDIHKIPWHLHCLKTEARKRGTILEFMPQHFSRHKENTTRYISKEKKIRWHLKLVFHQAGLTFVEQSVDEETPLIHLMAKYMEPSDPSLDPDVKEKLCYYHSASYRRVAVLLKCDLSKHDPKFVEMFLSKSLRINFAHRKIVEHPTIFVVLRDHIHSYLDYVDDGSRLFDEPETTELGNEAEKVVENGSQPQQTGTTMTSNGSSVPLKRGYGLKFFDILSSSSSDETDSD